ncbi:MAG TPA: hypothetical protein ENN67_02005, partial [Firmicutes bacterium]|nr:hypothetical protein [Bacillota bacterium]
MFVIPFMKTENRTGPKIIEPAIRPSLSDTVVAARAALATGAFDIALNLVAPWLTDDETPPIALLIAGRALTSLKRYPEALG